jgi:hypothetical protein
MGKQTTATNRKPNPPKPSSLHIEQLLKNKQINHTKKLPETNLKEFFTN